ncbi:MAG TPA: hypothetical protein VIV11_13805 [Kofleriaceae bacterium]
MPNPTNLLAVLAMSTSLVACAEDAPPQPDLLALPGQAYYPENVHADADGTLYVGSLTTGQLVAFDDGKTEPRTVLAAGAHGVTGLTGVLVHDDELWACSIDTMFQRPTEVRSFTLDGAPKQTYVLGSQYFCNDLAFDDRGNLYVTDSFSGTVQKLTKGATAFETFVEDPRFIPDTQGAFGLDGIVYTDGALYINKLDTGELYEVSLDRVVTEIVVSPPLAAPDGMRALGDNTLLVIEGGANRLSKLTVSGATATSKPVATDLDMPTGVAVTRGSAWVTEGQLGRLFAQPAQAPNLPFSVRRIEL